jgi:predicted MFS family arabinose efflux permease
VLGALTGEWGSTSFTFFVSWGQYPLYATRDLGLSPAAFGVVLSVVAVGGVVGALANERVTRRFGLGPTMAGAVFFGALGVLLVPAAPAFGAAAVVLVLGQGLVRITDQLYAINYTSVLQARTPDRLRGRVNAAVRVLTAGTAPLGAVLGGALGEAIGLQATAVVAGVGVLLAFLWVALSPARSLRSLTAEPDSATPVDAALGSSPPDPHAGPPTARCTRASSTRRPGP